MTILLLLVVAVFINIPAGLINLMLPDKEIFWIAVAAIFIYYICATLFPVDKIIGRIYPFFGMLLMLGTFALFIALMLECFGNPSLLAESTEFKKQMNTAPVIPVLFVTIACGIISGFHATQSPIIARTMSSEHQGRQAFYGMMVIEGLIAMIWAAAGMAIYNLEPALMCAGATDVLKSITSHFLGGTMSALTIIGIVVLAVTSGDTAMRSLRLSLSEILNINQKPFKKRILLCLPLIIGRRYGGLISAPSHSPIFGIILPGAIRCWRLQPCWPVSHGCTVRKKIPGSRPFPEHSWSSLSYRIFCGYPRAKTVPSDLDCRSAFLI